MPSRLECLADVRDGEVILPAEIVSRLRARGVGRVRVVITLEVEETEALRGRGIDLEAIARVSRVQGYEQDVALTTLSSEGVALGSACEARLRSLLTSAR